MCFENSSNLPLLLLVRERNEVTSLIDGLDIRDIHNSDLRF